MKRASISDAKNQLSALLDQVRHGSRVIIEDRGVPVATLEPVVGGSLDPEGRLSRLDRQGLVRRPSRPLSKALLATRPPSPRLEGKPSDIEPADRSPDR